MTFIVVNEPGAPCPRCRRPMQVREHGRIEPKQARKRLYYRRWFCCTHGDCVTTIVHREEFKQQPPPALPPGSHSSAVTAP